MALQKQIIPISFAQGVSTKEDPKQVIAGRFLTLENAVFTKGGQFSKRNGHQQLPPAGTLGSALASYNDELIAFNGLDVLSYSQALNTFTDKGQALSMDVTQTSVVNNGFSQSCMDGAFSAGLKTFAWEDTMGGIRYSVIDAETSQVIVSDVLLDSSGVKPKVFALGNYFVMMYFNGTHLVYKAFAINSPTVLIPGTLALDINTTTPVYDGTIIGTRLFFAYNTSGGTVAVNYLSAVLALALEYQEAASQATICIAIWGDGNQNAWVAFYDGTNVNAFQVSYNLVSVAPATVIHAESNVRNITGITTSTPSLLVSNASVIWEISSALTYNHFTQIVTIVQNSGTITPGSVSDFIRSVGLGSKLFQYNGVQYVGLAYESPLQPTYFVSTIDRLIVAKCIALNGGGLTKKSVLPEVSFLSANEIQIAWGLKSTLAAQNGTIYSTTGVVGENLSFLSTNTYLRATAANDLHITGGFISMYDSVSVVEHGFHLFPEQPTYTITTSGGGIGAGTFQYAVVDQWKDNVGNIHESAPSVPISVTTVAGTPLTFTGDIANTSPTILNVSSLTGLFVGQEITGTDIQALTFITAITPPSTLTMSNPAVGTHATETITTTDTNEVVLTIPTLRVTAKQPPRANVTICVYRTQDAGTVFYQVTPIINALFNDVTVDTVSFTDTMPDLNLEGNQLLYTTGGVVENISAPACSLIANFSNSVVVIPSETENQYWISKQIVPNNPVAFTDFFVQAINPFGGKETGIAQMDSNLIIFKQNCIFLTTGTGPNDTGQQSSLATPQLITTDCGCINPRSIVTMPLGLMFQSGKGIYLLDRSLNSQYIGADVEAFNSLTITSAQLIPNTNQVRFTTAQGTFLQYDYYYKQWSVFTTLNAADSAIFANQFTYIDPKGIVWQETPGQYLDGAEPIKFSITTSWLSFAGLQGFQRIYQTLILGEYKSLHKLMVNVAYDFDPNPTQQSYFDANVLATEVYGQSSPYGAEDTYGGDFPLYQFRVDMNRQKCQAIQFQIVEVPEVTYGEGLSLSGFTTLVGMKQGLYKIPANRQVGSS